MISAKLIKNLEKEGFYLDFPIYSSKEELIREILLEDNERLYTAIPILLKNKFDYKKIAANPKIKKKFDRILIIAEKIFSMEKINSNHLKRVIKENKIKHKIPENFEYYYQSFKESIKNLSQEDELQLKEEIKLRNKLSINKSLSVIFSPAKLRIMEEIFNHEPLTNTELKYYYKAIRPFNLAILNLELQRYVRIIESNKKYSK